jgi:hypothetical protein
MQTMHCWALDIQNKSDIIWWYKKWYRITARWMTLKALAVISKVALQRIHLISWVSWLTCPVQFHDITCFVKKLSYAMRLSFLRDTTIQVFSTPSFHSWLLLFKYGEENKKLFFLYMLLSIFIEKVLWIIISNN